MDNIKRKKLTSKIEIKVITIKLKKILWYPKSQKVKPTNVALCHLLLFYFLFLVYVVSGIVLLCSVFCDLILLERERDFFLQPC